MLIELQDVVYSADATAPQTGSRAPALANVTLQIAEGTTVALLGSSGTGAPPCSPCSMAC